MRFATRFDWWLVAVLAGIPLVFLYIGLHGNDLAAYAGVAIYSAVITCTLPQYYMLEPDALFIRQGWRRIRLPYGSISKVEAGMSALSAAVVSIHRITITANSGEYLIAVRGEERFLRELRGRIAAARPLSDPSGGAPGRSPLFR